MVLKYLEEYKNEIKKSIQDLKHKETFYRQIPNLLTFIRLVGGLPAGFIYYLNPYISISAIAFLWFTDAIDGRIAKKFNIQSKLGADMDAFADKIMFLGSSLPLLVNAPGMLINFLFEGVISLINVGGRVKGLNTKTVLSGKVKTVSLALTLVTGYLVQFFGIPVSLLKLLMIVTTGLQCIAIKDYVVEFNRMNNELKKDNLDNEKIDGKNEHVLEETYTLEFAKTPLEELKKERSFYLGMKEDNLVKTNKRIRKIEDEKKGQ